MVKILFLVDDDEDDRSIFSEAMSMCQPHIELCFACDGVEALKILESGQVNPDIIFLDYNMPRMNGLECLKRLKANEDLKSIPTVMYTTSGNRDHEKTVLSFGADYYMRKSFGFEQLCTELDRLIQLVDEKAQVRRDEQKL
jgi:CheY-like chemotaxis protein